MATVAIIGAGCSGTLVAQALSDLSPTHALLEVLLFDAGGSFGPGLPYGKSGNDDAFILNMKSSLLGVDRTGSASFEDWLQKRLLRSGTSVDDYARRSLMGEYLEDTVRQLGDRLSERGARLTLVQDSILDIRRGASGYMVQSATATWQVDRVVLAMGHLKKKSPFDAHPRYFANPYHDLARLKQSIGRGARVGVLGTKLTAVDMALMLDGIGASKIFLYSNSGQLPLVRGVIPDGHREQSMDECDGKTLRAFLRWFRRYRKYTPEYAGLLSQRHPLSRIEIEITAASKVRDWQLWLDATKSSIDDYWTGLDPVQKRRFFRKYQGLWMSYRHPMPINNARKVRALLQAGRLVVHAGYKSTAPLPTGDGFDVEVADRRLPVDYAIDATGYSGNLARLDSALIENLIDGGLVRNHEFGGVAIETSTHQLIGQRGLYAIGPLTQGALFYVSAIERLLVHADKIAQHILDTLGADAAGSSSAGAVAAQASRPLRSGGQRRVWVDGDGELLRSQ